MTAPSIEEMNHLIVKDMIRVALEEVTLENGRSALTFFGDSTHLHINPSGNIIIGGPQGVAERIGSKIVIDTCEREEPRQTPQ